MGHSSCRCGARKPCLDTAWFECRLICALRMLIKKKLSAHGSRQLFLYEEFSIDSIDVIDSIVSIALIVSIASINSINF